MPVTNSTALTLGRAIYDTSQVADPAVRKILDQLRPVFAGLGYPSAAQDGDTAYQGVYAIYTDPDWTLYAGKPSDPVNPDVISTTAGTTITFQEEGVTVLTSATLNVVGDDATVTNVGGVATLTITSSGSGTTYTEGFGIDIDGSNVISVVGYEGIVVDGNGVSVDFTADKGLELDTAGASGKLQCKAGTNITLNSSGINVAACFKTIAVSGQSDVVADAGDDTLTLVAGSNIAITTDAATDSVTLAASGFNIFSTVAVSGQSSVVADSSSDTLTLVAGTGITITTDASTDTITFTADAVTVPAVAMITGTVPAMATIDGTAHTATPGISLTDVATIVELTTVTVGSDVYPVYPPAYEPDGSYSAMKAINRTKTDIVGTSTVPLLYDGKILTCWDADNEVEVKVFEATGPHDIRSLPGYDSTAIQVVYHDADDESATLDSEACP